MALFNGVRQHSVPGQLDTRAWSDYRIENGDNTDMDILPGQENLSVYCATLGHKVNNSFDNNCTFARYWHPRFVHGMLIFQCSSLSSRFGNIMSIVSLRDIAAFDEVTVCYNYRLDAAPVWYTECWARWSEDRPGVRVYKLRQGDKVQLTSLKRVGDTICFGQ